MDKKAVSLSFNVIIIAILGLMVLVILIFLISKTATDTTRGTACAKLGGRCVESGTCDDDNTFNPQYDDKGNPFCQSGTCCSLVPIK